MLPESFVRRLTQTPGARTIWRHFPVGSTERLVRFGISPRQHYAYGVFSAAEQAKRLGIGAISVFGFGVAGGRELVALEKISEQIGAAQGVEISVLGFDGGTGMPAPEGYRDVPHVWARAFTRWIPIACEAG